MFYFIIRTSFAHGRQTIAASQNSNLLIFKQSSGLRFFSNSSNGHSFAASYLINKCGFSPEMASRVSHYVHFETPAKPDSLIAFLENHGFSNTQIVNLIKRQPLLLVLDAEKSLSPKLEFLYSIGFSRPELAKLLSNYPRLLTSSLEKQIIPSFDLLRNLFQSHDKTIKAIKRYTGVLAYDSESYLYPNLNVLRGIGVPESNILALLNCQPRSLLFNPVRLKEIVEEVKRMGIDSSRKKFLVAVYAFRSMSKSTLEKKIDVYRRWGWSDQEINEAFRRYPLCMTVSEDKIMFTMDFLVNKMGYSSTHIAKQPSFLTRSLEKRIMPRALFARELISQGLVNEFKLSALFDTSEKVFIRMLVDRFVNKAPDLLKLYKEKLKISEKKNIELEFVNGSSHDFVAVFLSSIDEP
ncbi:transcription termination factor MTERF15, mitochondrial-like [Gossypium arboreum]|uniref:transcription termination factor MTERF15, mitochondrial-like n=1 Tax=Gossypium arboreum TaxID=29729 RepID=UPI0022F18FE9|nr:transcription termination factor MTERF15, mitochondrial-like [Gossypium arboreum]